MTGLHSVLFTPLFQLQSHRTAKILTCYRHVSGNFCDSLPQQLLPVKSSIFFQFFSTSDYHFFFDTDRMFTRTVCLPL